jgi:hypothetical protein
MGKTHGGFDCKYGVHDPQLRVEQVMDFFYAPPRRNRKKTLIYLRDFFVFRRGG